MLYANCNRFYCYMISMTQLLNIFNSTLVLFNQNLYDILLENQFVTVLAEDSTCHCSSS